MSSGRLPGAFWEGFPTHFQATRGDRDAPYSNRRRGRVAPEQGYRRLYALAVSILGRPSLLSLCSSWWSCRSASRCSCCSLCSRHACNACTLSHLSRFPFHDSQVCEVLGGLDATSLVFYEVLGGLDAKSLVFYEVWDQSQPETTKNLEPFFQKDRRKKPLWTRAKR